jgi:hypothetical protein
MIRAAPKTAKYLGGDQLRRRLSGLVEEHMDRNAEASLRRKKMGAKLDKVAMRGPTAELVRHFLNVPRSQRREYYLICGEARYGPSEIENLARQFGIDD